MKLIIHLIRYLCFFFIYYLLYICSLFGYLFPRDKIQRLVVRWNNWLVFHIIKPSSSNKVLLLLPHCLQWAQCPFKVTFDVRNCRKCGKCQIADLIDLSDKLNLDIYIATGGTLARRAVKKSRPDLILAVACERDLFSGIQDTLPFPVIGVLNERPNGPCYNTCVSMKSIEQMLYRCLGKS